MKKLSVITICYNEPELERTCKSIIQQTWQDFEWVVVDGGSNSQTQAIWDKYKDRINIFISEKDTGIYNAMNKGIKLATGDYLSFMNAGDFFCDDNVLKDIFEGKEQTADVLYGDALTFLPKKKKWEIYRAPENLSRCFLITTTLNHQSTFIKRKLFLQYGLYDETLKIMADYDGFLRFFINNAEFSYLKQPVACYDSTGISSTAKELKREEFTYVRRRYFSEEEIEKAAFTRDRAQLTFGERLFSIKNSSDKKSKIITFLNIRIKIRRKKK